MLCLNGLANIEIKGLEYLAVFLCCFGGEGEVEEGGLAMWDLLM